ncbi:aldo/keto reductase [Bacteroidia bacterium]|nr:aldo/keto reductase [Bacteroidia bacterium]
MKAPRIIIGCMRFPELTLQELDAFVKTAVESDFNMFDHADIYGGNGLSEQMFGQVSGAYQRQQLILQTKCGICKDGTHKWYDFSRKHIMAQVEQSMKNLKTDYLDILLLHRPDVLADLDEIAEAFSELKKSGKVLRFGLSNHTAQHFDYIQSALSDKLVANQIQLSLGHSLLIDNLMYTNTHRLEATEKDGGILLYCKKNNINIQAWSPFQYGMFEGVFLNNPKFMELNKVLDELAAKYQVSKEAIAGAWVLRIAPNVQIITGTTNKERLPKIFEAATFELTRREWYDLYFSERAPL